MLSEASTLVESGKVYSHFRAFFLLEQPSSITGSNLTGSNFTGSNFTGFNFSSLNFLRQQIHYFPVFRDLRSAKRSGMGMSVSKVTLYHMVALISLERPLTYNRNEACIPVLHMQQ